MVDKIKVVVTGVNGRMGRAGVAAIESDSGTLLVGAVGRPGASYIGKSISEALMMPDSQAGSVKIADDLEACLDASEPDVLLDFTEAELAVEFAEKALTRKIRPVIGTSGIEPELLSRIESASLASGTGAMVVPNFSLGAVLMMEFARMAGKHFDNVEIVEMHHEKKLDAPSGTAMHTVRKLAEHGKKYNVRDIVEREIMPGARGAGHESGVRVHSLRLPGLISHQDVVFGSAGELLSIKHDSYNTSCFSRGILMSIKAVMQTGTLIVGLESLL